MSTLGSLVAVQLILTAQLADTYENPFLGLLTLLFGSRAFLKFMNLMLVHAVRGNHFTLASMKFIFMSIDTAMLACILELGVRPAANSESEYASTATGMLLIIVLGGSFLHTVIEAQT